ncbi:alanine racemase [Papillibacter cinnamivorans]|uniref:Alanine racemase n=1 Tax=Papillibacter cinnamivorans DSM 12816 TaxID=1122930 RepID=A0A1W1ZB63_9FIRM|nr:alanine racemase [Papillibacter cinnamivorans]SMC45576.1 alanine racemase [Papillibacter cinnamivorans DSM 12816]
MKDILRRTWAEISLDNTAYNYGAIRKMLAPGCRFMGVVKADAYGHGAVQISKLLEELGADYLAVSNIEEAMQLRYASIRLPILILGYTPVECLEDLLDYDITQTIYETETGEAFSRAAEQLGKRLRVHIKADTGMSRLGLVCDEGSLDGAAWEAAHIAKLPGLLPEGLFTHFAASDDENEEDYTRLQFDRFVRLRDMLREKYAVTFSICHCANSGAVLHYPWTHLDMARPGILLYGVSPCEKAGCGAGLRPVMTLKTVVSEIKELPGGITVSYGRTFRTEKKSRIAVMSAGYADGLPRSLSNQYDVLLRGKPARIRGRVCMDMTMLDVTDIPEARPGDEVEIFGEHLPVSRAAELSGTIAYELLCGISKRVPRLFFREGERCAVLPARA